MLTEKIMTDAKQLPIRFWWGFKRKEISRDTFLDKLGAVFLPATVQVMGHRLGALTAYLPIIPPENCSTDVPDEMALVVYRSVAEYEQASSSLEGRAYQLLHDAVFTSPSSSKGFPVLFEGELEQDQPYFLWSRSDQWQGAHCTFLLGRRPTGVTRAAFAANVQAALKSIAARRDDSDTPDTILVRVSRDVVSYCEMWAGSAIPNGECFYSVADTVNVLWKSPAYGVRAPSDLNKGDRWLRVSDKGEFLNLQF